jgi:hypothetical protein
VRYLKVIYRYYEPNQGLEEIQARLFTQASGENATADQIRQRYETEKTNPALIRYAFSEEEEKPLAYIQARIEENKAIAIGYPWAIPECPPEVQEKLFDEMLEFIKQKNPSAINYWLNVKWEKQIEFFKRKGFVRTIEGFRYEFDIEFVSQLNNSDSEFSSRIASDDDLFALVDLAKVDLELKRFFTKEWLTNYFKDKVLKDGHCVLVFKNDRLVCASAPLRDYSQSRKRNFILLRFTATIPGFEAAWRKLIIAVAKECVSTGWTDVPLEVNSSNESLVSQYIMDLNPNIIPTYDLYALKLENS